MPRACNGGTAAMIRIISIHEKEEKVKIVLDIAGKQRTFTVPASVYSDNKKWYFEYLKNYIANESAGWQEKDQDAWGKTIDEVILASK